MISIFKKLLLLDEHRHPIDRLTNVVAFISGIALYPQLFKLIGGSSPDGLSLATFTIIAINSVIWIIYGTHRQAFPIVVSSSLNFLAASTISIIILL